MTSTSYDTAEDWTDPHKTSKLLYSWKQSYNILVKLCLSTQKTHQNIYIILIKHLPGSPNCFIKTDSKLFLKMYNSNLYSTGLIIHLSFLSVLWNIVSTAWTTAAFPYCCTNFGSFFQCISSQAPKSTGIFLCSIASLTIGLWSAYLVMKWIVHKAHYHKLGLG